LLEEVFTSNYIMSLQKTSGKCDPAILEKTIHALALLEALAETNLDFIFKGGTSLILLLDNPKRLSTDIDIIVAPGTNIKPYLEKIQNKNKFIGYKEDNRPKIKDINKKHYKFHFNSTIHSKQKHEILLDVLYEENHYENVLNKKIESKLIRTDKDVSVKVPDIESLLGDKLTAFAPHTCGVILGGNKDLEVVKQFYDVKTLLNYVIDFNTVKKTYKKVVKQELKYRNSSLSDIDCLKDTLDASICIASQGKVIKEDYSKYEAAINNLRNHVFDERYNIQVAGLDACIVIYAVCCIIYNEEFIIDKETTNVSKYVLRNEKLKELNFIKKANIDHYRYLMMADKILNEKEAN